jgi:hypothetical protein
VIIEVLMVEVSVEVPVTGLVGMMVTKVRPQG